MADAVHLSVWEAAIRNAQPVLQSLKASTTLAAGTASALSIAGGDYVELRLTSNTGNAPGAWIGQAGNGFTLASTVQADIDPRSALMDGETKVVGPHKGGETYIFKMM